MLSIPCLVLAEDYRAREVTLDTKHRQPPTQVQSYMTSPPPNTSWEARSIVLVLVGFLSTTLLISWPERLWAQVRMKKAHGGFNTQMRHDGRRTWTAT